MTNSKRLQIDLNRCTARQLTKHAGISIPSAEKVVCSRTRSRRPLREAKKRAKGSKTRPSARLRNSRAKSGRMKSGARNLAGMEAPSTSTAFERADPTRPMQYRRKPKQSLYAKQKQRAIQQKIHSLRWRASQELRHASDKGIAGALKEVLGYDQEEEKTSSEEADQVELIELRSVGTGSKSILEPDKSLSSITSDRRFFQDQCVAHMDRADSHMGSLVQFQPQASSNSAFPWSNAPQGTLSAVCDVPPAQLMSQQVQPAASHLVYQNFPSSSMLPPAATQTPMQRRMVDRSQGMTVGREENTAQKHVERRHCAKCGAPESHWANQTLITSQDRLEKHPGRHKHRGSRSYWMNQDHLRRARRDRMEQRQEKGPETKKNAESCMIL